MKIGVIIPTFNSEETIVQCLDSLKLHKLDDKLQLKIIVIDDGSNDLTKKIVSNYYSEGLISKTIFLPSNKGVSETRNIGIDNCEDCEWIYFLDSDDQISSELNSFLINGINLAEKYKADIVTSNFVIKNNLSRVTRKYFDKITVLEKKNLIDYIKSYLNRPNENNLLVYIWGKIYRRSILENKKIRFNVNLRTNEDKEFINQILLKSPKLIFLPFASYEYNIRPFKKLTLGSPFVFGEKKDLNLNSFFAFLIPLRTLRKFYFKNCKIQTHELSKYFNHAISCYVIMVLIRACVNIKSIPDFLIIGRKLIKIVNNKYYLNKFNDYNSKRANGSFIIPFLIKHKFFWFALLLAVLKSRVRYRLN